MPNVSVIIPTYNRANMIGEAIQSVLDQTYTDWELIVIDDGSEDNTHQVVNSILEPRIRYLYQENKRLPGARNTGIRVARGRYIAFLDSDDLFLPHKLERQVKQLDSRSELGLIAGGYLEVDEQLRILREMRPWLAQPTLELQDWLLNCPFCPTVPLVRRDWLERVGLFDESMRRIEDWDLWLRLSHAGCQMDWIEEPVCCYRIHGGNMVRDVLLMKNGMIAMMDKLFEQSKLPTEIIALRNAAYANIFLNAAARAYAVNAPDEGKESLAQAIAVDPSLLDGDPPHLLSSLASFALSPLVDNAEAFLDILLSNMPNNLLAIQYSKRQVRGLLRAISAFDCYQRGENMAVTRHALSTVLYDPKWLRHRGLVSVTGRAIWRQAKNLTQLQ